MRALVIGINGFLGTALTEACLAKGWDTEGVHFRTYSPVGIKSTEMSDLAALKPDYDYVFLLAAKIPYGKYNEPDMSVVEANVILVHTVCKHFPNAKIVYSSSISVYGTPPLHEKITENTPLNHPPLYGLSKLSGEYIVRNHPHFSIVRFTSLYGKGMNTGTILPSMIHQAKTTGKIAIWGTGERKQDYIHVSDAAQYLIAAAERGENEVYLGVTGESIANLDLAYLIQSLVGKCEIFFYGEDASPSFEYNSSHTINVLRYTPNISLSKGIKTLL